MVVLVTLTSPGADTGPFNLFSSVDLVTPLVSGVAKSALVSGYTLSSVPDAATYIKVASTGTCTNSINLNIADNIYYYENGKNVFITITDMKYNRNPISDITLKPWKKDMDDIGNLLINILA